MLVLDDEPLIVDSLARDLTDRGSKVVRAGSTLEAEEVIRHAVPDVAVVAFPGGMPEFAVNPGDAGHEAVRLDGAQHGAGFRDADAHGPAAALAQVSEELLENVLAWAARRMSSFRN